jgi:hypothetical protein
MVPPERTKGSVDVTPVDNQAGFLGSGREMLVVLLLLQRGRALLG